MTKYVFDRDVKAFIEKCESFYSDALEKMELSDMRASYIEQCQTFNAPSPSNITVVDGVIANIPVRFFRPDTSKMKGLPGCLIYFHGGGWVLGGLGSHDSIVADLASRTGVVGIVVDYRVAPEHRYPAAFDDCWDVVQAITQTPETYGVDGTRIAVGGDSAGGNLSAAVTLKAKALGGPQLAAQILLYGAFGGIYSLPSYVECSDAPMLTTEEMHSYHEHYFGSRILPKDPLACPLQAENLEGLPPAFLSAAQYDPLRDDTIQYARMLEAAGVPVEMHIEQGLIHGFLRARHVSVRGAEAFRHICDAVQRLIGSKTA